MERRIKPVKHNMDTNINKNPKENYGDFADCMDASCNSVATALLSGNISVCPVHYQVWAQTHHEEEKEKIAGDAIFAMQKQTRAIEQATLAITDLQNKLAHKEQMEEILYDIIKASVPLHSKVIAKVKQIFTKKGVLIL